MESYLNIHKLILVGVRKNYEIKFNPGVNIIYGDSDTGKSSILEFIGYLLGCGDVDLADEIVSAVKYAAMELEINGNVYSIKRNIYDNKAYIEVFNCRFNECDKHFPDKYSPNFKDTNAPGGFYSDFILDCLGFPKVKIKDAPTRVDSNVKRLSFRNLFKYCYLNQDDVGSKGFLDQGNWSKATGTKEVFKYIFNVLDTNITELDVEISLKSKDKNELKQKYDVVSEFLRDTDYDRLEDIDDFLENIDSDIIELKLELAKINSSMVSDSDNYLELKAIFSELTLDNKNAEIEIATAANLVDKYSRLKNDYENDINKIMSIKLAKEKIGVVSEKSIPCPICDGIIDISLNKIQFDITTTKSLDAELESLLRRQKNINKLIVEQSSKYREMSKQKIIYENELDKARNLLDTESFDMITPYLTQRDTIVKEISAMEQIKNKYENDLKVRNKQADIYKKYSKLSDDIEKLKVKLSELKNNAPMIEDVLSSLGDLLNKYLACVNIKNRHGIKISENTYLPVIRNKDYFKITSGGLRTITSIGHMLGILQYAIEKNINHPKLLMIDTVGKYLGKTTKSKYIDETNIKDDAEEGMSDPLKYQNIYETIINLATHAENKGKQCQIILVDNDVPEDFVERYKGFIVAHYSSSGEDDLDIGLIDDAPATL